MPITGSLTDFSVPEIFRFIEKGQKTGFLSFGVSPATPAKPQSIHYIWVEQGRIVAAASQLDAQGLISLIAQHQWVSDRVFAKLLRWCCPVDQPLGLCLKRHGVLDATQLNYLFQVQVLQSVGALLQLKDAQFKFEQNVQLPRREMTGLSVPATEATLMGLRSLQNWEALGDQLPDPNASLASLIAGQPQQRLDALESQVWQYSQGTVSLRAIARQLRLPVERVQQIAFRLIAVGIAASQDKRYDFNSTLDSNPRTRTLLVAIG